MIRTSTPYRIVDSDGTTLEEGIGVLQLGDLGPRGSMMNIDARNWTPPTPMAVRTAIFTVGLTRQEDVAARLGVNPRTVRHWMDDADYSSGERKHGASINYCQWVVLGLLARMNEESTHE